MKNLVEYIVKQIVNNPDDVVVDEMTDGQRVDLSLSVNPEDMGIVIGRAGQTIKAIRKLLIVKAMADNAQVFLSLAEPEGGRPKSEEPQDDEEAEEAVEEQKSPEPEEENS